MRNNCRLRHIGCLAVLIPKGAITMGDGDLELRRAMTAQLDHGVKHILVNLTNVGYMDAAGVGELVACYNRARAAGATVKLLNPTHRAYNLLFLTKLEEVFEIYQDEREALVSFAMPSGTDRSAA